MGDSESILYPAARDKSEQHKGLLACCDLFCFRRVIDNPKPEHTHLFTKHLAKLKGTHVVLFTPRLTHYKFVLASFSRSSFGCVFFFLASYCLVVATYEHSLYF